MSDRLHHGRLTGTIADVLDSGFDLLPEFELAAVPMLEGAERPAEWPAVRRRLRAEGIRTEEHHGVLLLQPGDLDHLASLGFFHGNDELLLCDAWNEEFESFPGRLSSEQQDFGVTTPLGLEEWMVGSGCLLALGDGNGLNYATVDRELGERLRARFRPMRA